MNGNIVDATSKTAWTNSGSPGFRFLTLPCTSRDTLLFFQV